MKVLVIGANGLVGGAAADALVADGCEVLRGIRINAVSPPVLAEATGYHSSFPGFAQASAAAVGQCFLKAVRGVQTGRVFVLDA